MPTWNILMNKDVNFPLLIKICYDSKQYLRKIYSKCITTFSTYPFSPSSITRRSWNWTPREKNALTKPQLSHRGENLKTSFFLELLMHFRVRGCHKNLSILIFIIISWWDLKKQKEVCVVSFVREDTELQKYQKECNFHK